MRKIEEAPWAWHIGLDAESTAILNELWAGKRDRAGPHAQHPRLFALQFDDPAAMRADIAGRTVYLALSCEDERGAHEAAEPAASTCRCMKPEYWDRAKRAPGAKDPVMAAIMRRHPEVYMTRRGEPFMTLARAICGQQISVKAAQSVWNRVVRVLRRRSRPQNVLARKRTELRACGLSDRKTEYIADLAQHFADGKHPRARLAARCRTRRSSPS